MIRLHATYQAVQELSRMINALGTAICHPYTKPQNPSNANAATGLAGKTISYATGKRASTPWTGNKSFDWAESTCGGTRP